MKIKKKSTTKLNPDEIKTEFFKNISECGIIAYYIYKKIPKNLEGVKEDINENNNLTIEYFDAVKFGMNLNIK